MCVSPINTQESLEGRMERASGEMWGEEEGRLRKCSFMHVTHLGQLLTQAQFQSL